MSLPAPEVLADPLGMVVDLVAAREPALGRAVITDVVGAVAGGRAKQRRLARALADRPEVLVEGRSPAPQVVGDLLLALRTAGARTIAAPVCAECGKALQALTRRGENWVCAGCGRLPKRQCAGCGREQQINSLDRHRRPRCKQCPDRDGRDPLAVLTEVVATLEPSLSPETLTATAGRVCGTPAGLRRLAWTIEDTPGLLTGDGAQAPVPSVLRLIDALCTAGAQTITRPACPRCERVISLHRRIGGQWLCRNCVATSRAQPCSRCGAVREPGARDEHAAPLCANCVAAEPANHEACISCHRQRRVAVRTPEGPFCDTCRPWTSATCTLCGRHGPCAISTTTGQPWCRACKKRWARCTGCGKDQPVRGGTIDAPLCSSCTRPDPEFWRACPGCGQPGRIQLGYCARCVVEQRLRDLLGDHTGTIRPELRALYHALAGTDRPATVKDWLDASAGPALLRALGRGLDSGQPLTHTSLDQLPAGKAVEYLRAVLVSTGTLPGRDEQIARLERWITTTIAERADPDEQHLLHRYAVWHLLRRLRRRVGSGHTSPGQAVTVRRHVRAAIALLTWLAEHDLTLATAGQGDIETWLASDDATHRREAGGFVRWARREKLTSLDMAAIRWPGPTRVLDTEARWDHARRLLHDDTLTPEDRVAGLLILLYAQWPAAISRLTLEHLDITDHDVRIRLGHEPVVLPEPLAELVRQLVATRRGHAALGDPGTSRWLFPGGHPGRPISAPQLRKRLRTLGLRPGQARSTALFGLATDLPAALLARMLGIHINVAVAWQRASAGDWTAYAAQVSRRAATTELHPRTTGDSDHASGEQR
ncbi:MULTISPECIES: hypothetical protein [unclassified Pseudonocardia]|uniref:hypothetical protein n=1 Tax=unclassified Pseudonocardia TaxID=2619320 RepID=UPI000313FB77|nr:hypothetical protein [Pseudonocardia sp. Ae707_Ps1]OLM09175.1 hypothetical protein Ae707Ps1_6122 [Pseudonocardia sp. Ae707_Ps1]